ncbi:MAG: bifunctional (p)ppGpp synthetase/guanosine-3',5'-bis(diphosphate) 3'-pyrophosphohydrolase [Acidobacteriota bacterium]
MPLLRSKELRPPIQARAQVRFEDIVARLEETGRTYDPALLREVYEFSAEKHKTQVRRSGEPYLTHPLHVAWLLADLKLDATCVAVGLLHDVLEDTLATREELEARFGAEISGLVDGVTKIGKHAYVRRDQAQAETFRKMILASTRDIRVILVKLADRLHNLETLEHLSPESRRRIAQETLEIYAPIAHRLGMARVKGDLEDLAFFYLYPHQFAALKSKIDEKLKLGQDAIQDIHARLESSLREAGIECEISFRVKRFYSVHQKLHRQGIDVSQLYDYLAFRVVTVSLRDTYAALGVVHQSWRPIPGRFKDYIAMAKPNLYQSLHTTVVGDRGQPFEVQIRTREMDAVAEEGIAAHWRYKEGKLEPRAGDGNIVWLRQLLEWQQEVADPREFMTALKIDLYPDEVYAFTPRGEVFSFPRGATPLDLAYRVHTDLGHHCVGARVNGKLVPLRTALQNGDMVEILTSPQRNPSRDWLNVVTTSRARSKIRHWLNVQQKERAVEIGRRMLEKELRQYKVPAKKVLDGPAMKAFLTAEGIPRLDDLLARIGFGKAAVRQVLSRVLTDQQLAEPAEKPGALRKVVSRILPFGSGAGGPIAVKGQGDMLAFLAKCCSPLPGEDIIGYVTRGRGVSVHSVECPNVRNLMYNPEREIEVEWAKQGENVYQVSLSIETEDQPGILAKLTEVIAKLDSNIRAFEAQTVETGTGLILVTVEVRNRKHLEKLRLGIRALSGVIKVERRLASGGRDREENLL